MLPSTKSRSRRRSSCFLLFVFALLCSCLGFSFTHQHRTVGRLPLCLKNSNGSDDAMNIQRQLDKAKDLLAKSKVKLVKQEDNEEESNGVVLESQCDATNVPFFATTNGEAKRARVTLSENSDGKIRADGEKMAQLSEFEDWKSKPISAVFENELERAAEANGKKVNDSLASKDVAASIFNLRKSLHTEDYKKIFDRRNRFIGEDV